jgi:uncharacterized protein with HEPN domain
MKPISIILEKMILYAEKALSFIENTDEKAFLDNEEKQYAVSLAVLQIGELVALLPDDYRESNPAIPWKKIKGLRNIIVHQYSTVDEMLLWNLVSSVLPGFIKDIMKLRE